MNSSGIFNAFRLITQPHLCLPHSTMATFDKIPIPVSKALIQANGGKEPDIKAIVLDKDNCFAKPKENTVYPPYKYHFEALRQRYPGKHLLIVSNSAGTLSDPGGKEASLLDEATGIEVFRHAMKKPGCGKEVLDYLRADKQLGITHAGQIAFVGDRLFTDIMMANMCGAWGIWIKDGVVRNDGMVSLN